MRKFFITEDQINQQFAAWDKLPGSYQQMKILEIIVMQQEIKESHISEVDNNSSIQNEL